MKILCWIFITLGLLMRFYNLSALPQGIDGDEGMLALTAYKALLFQKWTLLTPFEGETLAGMLYVAIDWLTGLYRLGPSLLGVLEIYLLYRFMLKLTSNKVALFAAAFLAICPWHLYFSRHAGPLTGVSLFTLSFLLAQSISSKIIIASLSLMWYPTARLFLAASLFLKNHTLKIRLGILLISVSTYLTIYWLSQNDLSKVIARGAYHYKAYDVSFSNVYSFFKMFFLKTDTSELKSSFRNYRPALDEGFWVANTGEPLYGWFGLALIIIGAAVVVRQKNWPSMRTFLGVFFLLCFLSLAPLGPSSARVFILMPFLLLLLALGFEKVTSYFKPIPTLLFTALILSSLTINSLVLFKNLAQPQFSLKYFAGFHQQTAEQICKWKQEDPESNFYYVPVHYSYTAEWLSLKYPCFTVLDRSTAVQKFIGQAYPNSQVAHWVVFQSFDESFAWIRPFSGGIANNRSQAETFYRNLLRYFGTLEKREILFETTVISNAYKLRLKD